MQKYVKKYEKNMGKVVARTYNEGLLRFN